MKKYALVALISLSLVACNKDEDIVIENPDDNTGTGGGLDTNSPALAYQVIEYTPGPGQYINDPVTGGAGITSAEEAVVYATSRLEKNLYVSLGAWGGYIVVKFNEPIANSGSYDFSIGCNAFDSSSEPGIVWVMKDENGNGMADDVWYELKGSYFGQPDYERNYWVRYKRPGACEPTHWEDSNGETGYVNWMGSYHSQEYYYPEWVKEDSYTLYGSRLPLQAVQDEITGQWRNEAFDWGYADNFGEDFTKTDGRNFFRISDAVTSENEPAHLPTIDFVKVQTGVNGTAGWLGENSTEVTGFYN